MENRARTREGRRFKNGSGNDRERERETDREGQIHRWVFCGDKRENLVRIGCYWRIVGFCLYRETRSHGP